MSDADNNMGISVAGHVVWGPYEALSRLQDYMLLDSNHPQEKKDVRRSLMRQLEEAEARIRLLEQQLKTAREALEPFAAAWNVHSGKPDVLRHLTLGDLGALAAHHVSGIHFKNAAAAIRSLGEPSAHPPGE